MDSGESNESSAEIGARVAAARAAATARWAGLGWKVNADVPGPYLRQARWRLPAASTDTLRRRLDRGSLSARGFDRIIRMAWTISDLDGRDRPGADDVAEATNLRTMETS